MEVVLTAKQLRAAVRAIAGQHGEEFIVSDDGGEPITIENANTRQVWQIDRNGQTVVVHGL